MELYKDKDWLKEQYINTQKNTYQIAKVCECSHGTINNWLNKYNIPRRARSEARHLANANHCNITPKLLEVISGEFLGDSNLTSSNQYSACLRWTQQHKKHTQHIKSTFAPLGINGGKIREYKNKKTNKLYYCFQTYSYEELRSLWEKWYLNGKKIVPKDIELTSTTCLHWYLGDGSIHNQKSSKSSIKLSTYNFPIKDVESLVEKLNNLGFKVSRRPSDNTIGISTESTLKFLEYIGPCPVSDYYYKWDYQDNRKKH